MISASRNMVLGFSPIKECEQSKDASIVCPKCSQGSFVRRLGTSKYFCVNCDTEFSTDKKPFNWKRKKRTKKRKRFNFGEELNLARLLIKIERLRYKLNSTSLEDRQKLLLLSQKLDKLIVIYQRALLKTAETF